MSTLLAILALDLIAAAAVFGALLLMGLGGGW